MIPGPWAAARNRATASTGPLTVSVVRTQSGAGIVVRRRAAVRTEDSGGDPDFVRRTR
ncbi:hypothetical protein SXCC_00375 [Gluconacetobacter sp. SXCC-1]|nr:hypothetical protein SXCC_00375 [Gluconacetobacter sp. SXCC-1]